MQVYSRRFLIMQPAFVLLSGCVSMGPQVKSERTAELNNPVVSVLYVDGNNLTFTGSAQAFDARSNASQVGATILKAVKVSLPDMFLANGIKARVQNPNAALPSHLDPKSFSHVLTLSLKGGGFSNTQLGYDAWSRIEGRLVDTVSSKEVWRATLDYHQLPNQIARLEDGENFVAGILRNMKKDGIINFPGSDPARPVPGRAS